MTKNKKKILEGIELEDYLFSTPGEKSASAEFPLEKKKLGAFWFVIMIILAILGARVFYLNIVKGGYYKQIAKVNSIRLVPIKAPRGKIVDRFGNLLVNNVPSVDAVAIPADFPKDSENLKKLIGNIAGLFSLDESEITDKINSVNPTSLSPILIKENITQEEYLALEERKADFPGILTDRTAIRNYPDSSIFSHILGYIGKVDKKELDDNPDYLFTDYIGKQGVEKSYEKYLKGKSGAIKVEVDSLGNIKNERGIILPQAGSDLVLGVDYDLQRKIYDILSSVIEKTGTRTAAAIALDPRNGEVRAMVSLPSFDNNIFSGKISRDEYSKLINDSDKPLFNRAISGEYPPGSTLKPVIASAALSEGVITPSTIINGLGGMLTVGSYHFGDWKAHGPSDIRTAIAESNDIFFYTIGGGYGNIDGLGMDRMKKYENLFGLGDQSGVDIPGESSGFIPSTQWKMDKLGERWYTGDDYHSAIGQGFITVTPLQVANFISTIANGGTLYQPRIVSKILGNRQETYDNSLVILRDKFISPDVIKVVQEGMRQTITSGTARSLNDLPVTSAGKTGTAQFGSENKTHAWFASYAPYEYPELAIVILVEGGGEGNSSAVPATKEIYNWYFTRDKQ